MKNGPSHGVPDTLRLCMEIIAKRLSYFQGSRVTHTFAPQNAATKKYESALEHLSLAMLKIESANSLIDRNS